jgi:hypothetical protein
VRKTGDRGPETEDGLPSPDEEYNQAGPNKKVVLQGDKRCNVLSIHRNTLKTASSVQIMAGIIERGPAGAKICKFFWNPKVNQEAYPKN